MKNTAMFWVVATTLVLFSLTIMATMNFPFNWVFYITVIGQIMLVYMVFRVLTDNYTTDKTFKDFYEDYPLSDEIN
jgi:TRAP-type C4-dicarboxylate transport system permease small subunit